MVYMVFLSSIYFKHTTYNKKFMYRLFILICQPHRSGILLQCPPKSTVSIRLTPVSKAYLPAPIPWSFFIGKPGRI